MWAITKKKKVQVGLKTVLYTSIFKSEGEVVGGLYNIINGDLFLICWVKRTTWSCEMWQVVPGAEQEHDLGSYQKGLQMCTWMPNVNEWGFEEGRTRCACLFSRRKDLTLTYRLSWLSGIWQILKLNLILKICIRWLLLSYIYKQFLYFLDGKEVIAWKDGSLTYSVTLDRKISRKVQKAFGWDWLWMQVK